MDHERDYLYLLPDRLHEMLNYALCSSLPGLWFTGWCLEIELAHSKYFSECCRFCFIDKLWNRWWLNYAVKVSILIFNKPCWCPFSQHCRSPQETSIWSLPPSDTGLTLLYFYLPSRAPRTSIPDYFEPQLEALFVFDDSKLRPLSRVIHFLND